MSDVHRLSCVPDPNEALGVGWPITKRVQRKLTASFCGLSDFAWPLLTPLERHVVICGYSRSGTTLLQSMLEYIYPSARRFTGEMGAVRAITRSWRNHRLMITKRPMDVLCLQQLINHYARRRASLRAIVMIRDPRDVLTSRHAAHDRPYFLDPADWRVFHTRSVHHHNDPEVMTLKYERLVSEPARVQHEIERFVGRPAQDNRRLPDFHRQPHDDFVATTLNGVRPLDSNSIGRWTEPRHKPRLRQILHDLPDFPQNLIQLGYESSTRWTETLGTPEPSHPPEPDLAAHI